MLYLIHRSQGFLLSRKALVPGLLVCASLATAPYLLANLNESASLKYAASLLRLDPRVAKSGMVQMAAYYHAEGMSVRADSLTTAIHRQFAEIDLIQSAHDLIAQGRIDDGQRAIDALARIDPYSGELLYLRGMVAFGRKNYAAAAEAFEQLRRLSPYDYAVYVNLGGAYSALGQDERAMANFRQAYTLSPLSVDVLEELAMAFCRRSIYDSALFYGSRALTADNRSLPGSLAVGLASANLGDTARAVSNLTRYLETAVLGKWRDEAQQTLDRLRRDSLPRS
jgi:tetratricopeptide (TPR) repeat protein